MKNTLMSYSSIQKGFNSDLNIGTAHVHIQTEDWGKQNPFIVTKVFKNGAVVQSIKTPYKEVLPFGPVSDDQAIRLAMQEQHQKILDRVLCGQFTI